MNTVASITLQKNCIVVAGDLNFFTVMSLLQESRLLFSKVSAIRLDFSQVAVSNSAGLALILEWIKMAKTQKKSIVLINLPEQLISIAKVCGIVQLVSESVTV